METTNKIIIDDGTADVEFACGLCGDFLMGPGVTECEMCGAFIHPEMKDKVMTQKKFNKTFEMPY